MVPVEATTSFKLFDISYHSRVGNMRVNLAPEGEQAGLSVGLKAKRHRISIALLPSRA
jgi:hypothetical protein